MSSIVKVNSVKPIQWERVFESNENEVVDFAEQNVSFRNFKRSLSGEARKEINKLTNRPANIRRQLARRACRRRFLAVL